MGCADGPGLARLSEERLDDAGLQDSGLDDEGLDEEGLDGGPDSQRGSETTGDTGAAGGAGTDAVCSKAGLKAEAGTQGAVVGCPDGLCGAVVGLLEDAAVDGGQSSPKADPTLEFRLVTLNQLTGRTRVLGCVMSDAGVVVPSVPASLCGSLEEKAALSLSNNEPTFFSPPNEEVNDLLLSWLGRGC